MEHETHPAPAHSDHQPDQGVHDGHSGHDHAGHEGHDAHAHHDPAMFRDRFWLSLALTLPVLYFSETVQGWFGYQAPQFPGSDWVAPVLGTVIFVYGGAPFLTGARAEIKSRQPGMMLLIGMAITVAFVASIASVLGWFDLEFWWELAALITIMLLGHWMEMRSIGQAKGALAALAELIPDEAERVVGSETETVSVSQLRVGDTVLVRAGGRVPADGTITTGIAAIDESMVTGESRPVTRAIGEAVAAGTVVTDTSVRIEVTALGDDTALAGIRRLVEEAQSSQSRAQVLADRAAAMLFYVAVGAGALTLAIWLALGDPEEAVVRVVAVLVIACPHALGLAIPLVVSTSTSMAANNGILVRDRLALEQMRTVDVVVFDKTGTLTKGQHVVVGTTATNSDPADVLRLAASAERESEHPLARAILHAAEEPIPAATGFETLSGRGVRADIEGHTVTVGGPSMLREFDLDTPDEIRTEVIGWEERGAAVLSVVRDGQVIGAISLEDEIRAESAQAIDTLHRQGIQVAMLTGDAHQVANAVAEGLGIDEVLAEVLPEDKHARIAELQATGHTVAMVGDGVNDAPALAQADVGIAIGAGTDVAMESAGIVLASDDPRSVSAIRILSGATYRKMVQNLWWAAGYNVLAIPAAAGAFLWAGFVLGPALGAVLMSTSTVVVALNALLLRRLDLAP